MAKGQSSEVIMSGVVEVDFEGKTYSINYSVEKGLITVSTKLLSKTTQVGGSPPEALARIMAGELLGEAKQKGLL
ncbi:hypothetical protein D3C84_968250 [compost metagenome]